MSVQTWWCQICHSIDYESYEEEHSKEMSPNVDTFVMQHEQTLQYLSLTVKAYSVPSDDMVVVYKEFFGIGSMPYVSTSLFQFL